MLDDHKNSQLAAQDTRGGIHNSLSWRIDLAKLIY